MQHLGTVYLYQLLDNPFTVVLGPLPFVCSFAEIRSASTCDLVLDRPERPPYRSGQI